MEGGRVLQGGSDPLEAPPLVQHLVPMQGMEPSILPHSMQPVCTLVHVCACVSMCEYVCVCVSMCEDEG